MVGEEGEGERRGQSKTPLRLIDVYKSVTIGANAQEVRIQSVREKNCDRSTTILWTITFRSLFVKRHKSLKGVATSTLLFPTSNIRLRTLERCERVTKRVKREKRIKRKHLLKSVNAIKWRSVITCIRAHRTISLNYTLIWNVIKYSRVEAKKKEDFSNGRISVPFLFLLYESNPLVYKLWIKKFY